MKSFLHSINSIRNKIISFGWFIPVSHIFLILFGRYIPKNLSMNLVNNHNQLVCNHLQSKFNFKCIPIYKPAPNYSFSNAPIWFCWLQGEKNLSDIPALCLKSIKKHSGNHPVVVLSVDNFSDYVKIDPHIIHLYEKGRLKPAHFADILRVNLLAQRGGLWLDATLMLTKKIDELFFSEEFYTIKIKTFGNYISQCRWSVFCLSCQPGNLLFTELSRLFSEYLLVYTEFIDYFLFDHFINLLYINNEAIRKMIDHVTMNNPQVHSLSGLLCQNYNKENYKKLSNDTQIFKLSTRKYNSQQLHANPKSYFAYFEHIFNEL